MAGRAVRVLLITSTAAAAIIAVASVLKPFHERAEAGRILAVLADLTPGQTTVEEFESRIRPIPQSGALRDPSHISFGVDNTSWFSKRLFPATNLAIGVDIKNGRIDSVITGYTRLFGAAIVIHDGESRSSGQLYLRHGAEQSMSIYLPKGSTPDARSAAYELNLNCFVSWQPCDTIRSLLPGWNWNP